MKRLLLALLMLAFVFVLFTQSASADTTVWVKTRTHFKPHIEWKPITIKVPKLLFYEEFTEIHVRKPAPPVVVPPDVSVPVLPPVPAPHVPPHR